MTTPYQLDDRFKQALTHFMEQLQEAEQHVVATVRAKQAQGGATNETLADRTIETALLERNLSDLQGEALDIGRVIQSLQRLRDETGRVCDLDMSTNPPGVLNIDKTAQRRIGGLFDILFGATDSEFNLPSARAAAIAFIVNEKDRPTLKLLYGIANRRDKTFERHVELAIEATAETEREDGPSGGIVR